MSLHQLDLARQAFLKARSLFEELLKDVEDQVRRRNPVESINVSLSEVYRYFGNYSEGEREAHYDKARQCLESAHAFAGGSSSAGGPGGEREYLSGSMTCANCAFEMITRGVHIRHSGNGVNAGYESAARLSGAWAAACQMRTGIGREKRGNDGVEAIRPADQRSAGQSVGGVLNFQAGHAGSIPVARSI